MIVIVGWLASCHLFFFAQLKHEHIVAYTCILLFCYCRSQKIKRESSVLQKRKPVIAESDSDEEFIPVSGNRLV